MSAVYVIEADLDLAAGIDPREVGAAVTVALCGHWAHEGPCRWPHNNAIEGGRFRTLCVADGDEFDAVAERIEAALRGGEGWTVRSIRRRDLAEAERELADRLVGGPRATG